MNTSAAKVGEIFTEAGAAFNKLADMVMLLHPLTESAAGSQVKNSVKRKTEDKPINSSSSSTKQAHIVSSNPQQVTLTMLNSSEGDVKIEPSNMEVTELESVKGEART